MPKSRNNVEASTDLLKRLDAGDELGREAAKFIRAMQIDHRDEIREWKRAARDNAKIVSDAQNQIGQARAANESRERVVHAYHELRAIRALELSPESAIRQMWLELQALPSRLAPAVELEELETVRDIITIECWRIEDNIESCLRATDRAALTPLNARYIAAHRELEPHDLELDREVFQDREHVKALAHR